MTYLELVNKILIRLREDTVATVNQTAYSRLIGEFANDALRLVEDAWDWSALRTTVTITTSANIFNYALTGCGNRTELLNFLNATSKTAIMYKPQTWFDSNFILQNVPSGSPTYFTYNGVDSSGDTLIDIYPIPDGVYNLLFNCIMRPTELVEDTDQFLVPHLPVVHLAVALATRERGESGGNLTPELFASADRMLSDAIALDSAKHPEELVFAAV